MDDAPAFESPGRGWWRREVSHFPRGQTPLYRAIYAPALVDGMGPALTRYGVPGSHLEMRHVNDFGYMRMMPLFEVPARLARREPPRAALWLLSRLVPQLRRRTSAARRAFETRAWREDGRRWYEEQKPAFEAANLTLQQEPLEHMTDAELAGHIARAFENVRSGIRVHFELTIPTTVAVGNYLVAAEEAGIDPVTAVSSMRGASPASAEVVGVLAPVVSAARSCGRTVETIEDLYELGPEAAAALDEYLRRFAHRVIAGYDLDQPTLGEQPELVVSAVRSLAQRPTDELPTAAEPIHDTTGPLGALLVEARYAYGLRDDNSGHTLHWPAGVARRGVLEAAHRLANRSELHEVDHVFELAPDELLATLDGHALDPDAIAARAHRRAANLTLDPPAGVGHEEAIPPLDALPRPLGRVGAAMLAVYLLFESNPDATPLTGTGIGGRVVCARARVATDPAQALAVLEPGDVLVVSFTTPAYNMVLPVVSGLVVEEGGALSHAALVARELDIPAVIGVSAATQRIADGTMVELDPSAGSVRVVTTPM